MFSIFIGRGGQAVVADALYNEIGPMVSRARKADVLVLGNSRLLYAFRDELMEGIEKKNGLSFFNLSDAGENVRFSRDIIFRNRLFPRFIIVNDDNFFGPGIWLFQKELITSSWWTGWSSFYISYFQTLLLTWLRKFMPEFNYFKADHGNARFTLMSPDNGFLLWENYSITHEPFTVEQQKSKMDRSHLGIEGDFIKEMKSRGSEVILTVVPYGPNPNYAMEEAKEFGVPCILPKVEGLETFDKSHLTPESSGRFAEAFFDVFFKLPEVRKLLRERRGK